MKFIDYTTPKLLIADEGKKLRDVNDIARTETDDEGNVIEITPYYTNLVFIPDNVTEEEALAMYVEEDE